MPHGVQRLGQGADLVDLDQDRVGDAALDALGQDLRVGDEQVVADELDLGPQRSGQRAPSRPSRPRPCRPRSRRSGSGCTGPRGSAPCPPESSVLALARQLVAAVLEELAGGHVEREDDVVADLVAGRLDRLGRGSPAPRRHCRDWARSRPRRRHWCCGRRPSGPCAGRGRSRPRCAGPRRSSAAPTGRIMNSWMSIGLSAWAPPLMTFIIGIGSTRAPTPPR